MKKLIVTLGSEPKCKKKKKKKKMAKGFETDLDFEIDGFYQDIVIKLINLKRNVT